MTRARKKPSRGAALVALAALGFGSLAIFGKLAYGLHVPTASLLAGRFVVAAVVLWLVVVVLRRAPVPRSHVAAVAALGFVYAVVTGSYFLALRTIPAALTSLLLFTFPAIVTVVEHFFGDRLTPTRLVAVVAAVVGTALVIGAPAQRLDVVGIAFGLASAAVYSVYILVGARVLAEVPSIAGTALIATSAAIVFGVWALVARDVPPPLSLPIVGVVLGLAIFCGVGPILAQAAGMPQIGAGRAAIIGTLEPVATVVLAVVVLGDRFTIVQLAGGAIVVGSIVLREYASPPTPEANVSA